MDNDLLELHAIISGEVQGVCFRAFAKKYAETLHLCGTVRNMANGNVELIAQGKPKQLEELLAAINAKPGYGSIDAVEVIYRPITTPLDSFHVIH